MYKTVSEAIEIARSTYQGRTYTMGVYEEKDGKEVLIRTVTGDAVYIYAKQLFHDMRNDSISFWPVSDDDVEGMALMETIFAVSMHRAPCHDFEIKARDFLNCIVEEFENK